jgi:atypical dual specificity phosphatase
MQGISRSATVVCAYLVATTDLTAPKSIEHVQSIRGIVCPNLGFRMQLDEYSTRYVKLKPHPPQTSLRDVFKISDGGIAARIRKRREAAGKTS